MTLLIAIKTNHGPENIVFGGDRQLSIYRENGEMEKKLPIRKIHYGDFWAMGDSGGDDYDVRRLYCFLKGHKNYDSSLEKAKETLEQAIKLRDFQIIRELNKTLMRKNNDIDNTHNFILAVNKPKIGLWFIDEFGNFHDPKEDCQFEYICTGNGQEAVENYIENMLSKEDIDRDKITTRTAIKIVVEALQVANKVAEIGFGYDFLVINNESIIDYGSDVNKTIRKAAIQRWKEIMDHYPE